jgi:hypothetical protein
VSRVILKRRPAHEVWSFALPGVRCETCKHWLYQVCDGMDPAWMPDGLSKPHTPPDFGCKLWEQRQ